MTTASERQTRRGNLHLDSASSPGHDPSAAGVVLLVRGLRWLRVRETVRCWNVDLERDRATSDLQMGTGLRRANTINTFVTIRRVLLMLALTSWMIISRRSRLPRVRMTRKGCSCWRSVMP